MGDVIKLPIGKSDTENPLIPMKDSVTTCPECGCQQWYIYLNELGKDFDNVNGIACANVKCGFFVKFKEAL